MAESAQEKTEQPSESKLQRARERGEIPFSRDLNSAVLLAVLALLIIGQLPAAALTYAAQVRVMLGRVVHSSPDTAIAAVSELLRQSATLIAVPLATLFAAALAISALQTRGVFSVEKLNPQLSRLNPGAGFKRVVSRDNWVELLKSIFKFITVGSVCWFILSRSIRPIVLSVRTSPESIGTLLLAICGSLLKWVTILFAFLAAIDILLQRYLYLRGQRMTKDDVTREQKEQFGDPSHRAERKRLHEEVALGQMLEDVRGADVIIVNPTEYAVALRYRPDKDAAPRLVGKGQGYIAARIRKVAEEQGIPIRRDIGLARSLHALRLNTAIPRELYAAVQALLRAAESDWQQKGKAAPWRAATANKGQ